MGGFAEGTRRLQEKVGDGKIIGRVSFSPDKIAVPQERGTWFSGPNAGVLIRNYTTPGTGAHYMENSLLENAERYFAEIARDVIEQGARAPMERVTHDLLGEAQRRIPRKTGHLAESGEASVSEEFAGALLG
jgi:hypothetical protein